MYFSGALIFTEVNENSLLEEIEADDKQEAYTQLRQPKGMMVMVMAIKLKRFLLSCEQAYMVYAIYTFRCKLCMKWSVGFGLC